MNRSKQAGMGIRTVVVLLVGLVLASVHSADAQQQTKVPKIGWLGARSALAPARDVFERELRALGYIEGKNIAFEYRYAEGRLDRLPALTEELIRLKVDVLLTPATPAALACKNATRTIPIVFSPGLILLRLGWLKASRAQGETSRGSLQ
jgi:putative ABC transport system substrate-binding protein